MTNKKNDDNSSDETLTPAPMPVDPAIETIAKKVKAKVIVPGKKRGAVLERAPGDVDIVGHRIHKDGKHATVLLCDGQRVEVKL